MMKRIIIAAIGGLILMPAAYAAAPASSVTANFNVTITIAKQCLVTAPATLDLGVVGASDLIATSTSVTGTYQVNCSKMTPYTVTFAGADDSVAGGAVHQMKGTATNTDLVQYSLFDGTTATGTALDGAHPVSGTGTGASVTKSLTAQVVNYTASVTPDVYTDTVTMSVIY
jgi:spore coat protein U-like protein